MSIDQIKVIALNPRHIDWYSDEKIVPVRSLSEIYLKWSQYEFDLAENVASQNRYDAVPFSPSGVPEGERTVTLTKIVGKLVSVNLDTEWIIQICTDWNYRNKPPIKSDELIKKIKDLLKRFNTDRPFLEFEICLLCIPGTEREKLIKILCYCVKAHHADPSLILKLGLEEHYERYCEECISHIEIFKRYGKLVFARVGQDFFFETLHGKIKFNMFSIYIGIVSFLGRKEGPPKVISNRIILLRSRGFKNDNDYTDFCSNYRFVPLPTDYSRRMSLERLRGTGMKMIGMGGLKKGRKNHFSTYYSDQAILNYLIEKEKRKIDKKNQYYEAQKLGQELLKNYKKMNVESSPL